MLSVMNTTPTTDERDIVFSWDTVKKEFWERFGQKVHSVSSLKKFAAGRAIGRRKIIVKMETGRVLFPLNARGISWNMFQKFGQECQKIYEEDWKLSDTGAGLNT
jgi:hypothetical protein